MSLFDQYSSKAMLFEVVKLLKENATDPRLTPLLDVQYFHVGAVQPAVSYPTLTVSPVQIEYGQPRSAGVALVTQLVEIAVITQHLTDLNKADALASSILDAAVSGIRYSLPRNNEFSQLVMFDCLLESQRKGAIGVEATDSAILFGAAASVGLRTYRQWAAPIPSVVLKSYCNSAEFVDRLALLVKGSGTEYPELMKSATWQTGPRKEVINYPVVNFQLTSEQRKDEYQGSADVMERLISITLTTRNVKPVQAVLDALDALDSLVVQVERYHQVQGYARQGQPERATINLSPNGDYFMCQAVLSCRFQCYRASTDL